MLFDNKAYCATEKELRELICDARQRTHRMVDDLDDLQLEVPQLANVNPLRWEIGHVAYFFEVFFLQILGHKTSILPGVAKWFDSSDVAHDKRWSLPLPSRTETVSYMDKVLEAVLEQLGKTSPTNKETYLALLCTFHEDMHGEAIMYTRQMLEYPPPMVSPARSPSDTHPLPGDVTVDGREFLFGSHPEAPFVFDNEKWAHSVYVPTFEIARAPVTNESFSRFVDDGGYLDRKWWGPEGWRFRCKADLKHPVYWVRGERGWLHRQFNELLPIQPQVPVVHVSWYEAQAYCCWADRRLPTEVEWEMASAGDINSEEKRLYPWGNGEPTPDLANLDMWCSGPVAVSAYPDSDSAYGCRQMIGNVWEWTDSSFGPFPGYVVDFPYRDYSEPWFGSNRVLRGGSWTTRARLIRNTYRNFFPPYRNDILAGFRTCARRRSLK